ncbi:MAG TPA: hypothetical protein VNN73_19565 [Blastocatellia bacterium]|jgi:hypothetical protein|nr:hypothetical protein [Blastocatellia bacterium]
MKECPNCRRVFPDENSFCSVDGTKLIRSVQSPKDVSASKGHRLIPPPPKPLPMRLTIIDQGDEGHRSRVIEGLVLDVGQQGMRIQTGTVETGKLHIIRDHTVAFKNKLEVEIDLPNATVRFTGFAAWYRPEAEGLFWVVGVYIRDMSATDRKAYDEYLRRLQSGTATESAPA